VKVIQLNKYGKTKFKSPLLSPQAYEIKGMGFQQPLSGVKFSKIRRIKVHLVNFQGKWDWDSKWEKSGQLQLLSEDVMLRSMEKSLISKVER